MTICDCSETTRCAEAHALRDVYQAVPDIPARRAATQAYTAHLMAAGLLQYPTTAAPTWTCATACDADAPCRAPQAREREER